MSMPTPISHVAQSQLSAGPSNGGCSILLSEQLLRVLEEKEVERIGSGRPVPVNVRVLVATHHDLAGLVHQGKFREDLYLRIGVFPVTLPPLRARADDIAPLAEHFATQVCAQNGRKPAAFAPQAMDALRKYRGRGTSASCATCWSVY